MAATAIGSWRPRWRELSGDVWFCEGPGATEVLLEPVGGGRWRWVVSEHTVTALEQRAAGETSDRGKAAMAAERVCRRVEAGAQK